MSKSRCAKNITKQKCPQTTNLLVYERKPAEYINNAEPRAYVPQIPCPPATRIKICTGAEMKKMCTPPPCPCPPKVPRPTMLMRLTRLAGFGVKSLLAFGAVFVTYDIGIWGDSQSTGEIYKAVCEAILPRFVEPAKEKETTLSCREQQELFSIFKKDPYCCDKFPIDHESGSYQLKQKWNHMVTTAFGGLVAIPKQIDDISHRLYCWITPDSQTCVNERNDDKQCCPCK